MPVKNAKKISKTVILITIVMVSFNLHSCNNITVADFSPNDIGNIMAFLFPSDGGGYNAYNQYDHYNQYGDDYEIYESGYIYLNSAQNGAPIDANNGNLPVDNVGNITDENGNEAAEDNNASTGAEMGNGIPAVTPEYDTAAHTDSPTEQVVPPPVIVPEPPPQQASPQRTPALVRTYTLFPEVPSVFERVAFPSSLRMTDAVKQNIRILEPFTARSFRGTTVYIMTTNPLLFTPEIGGGYVSDMRNYRTRLVETATGARIGTLPAETQNLSAEIERELNAGVHIADILAAPLTVQSRLAERGMLTNLRRVPFMNLSAEHYNQSAVAAGTINGNLYSIVSDVLFDPGTIYAMFFNRDLITRHNLPNPAELHINGTWTYDSMFELGRQLTASVADLNLNAESGIEEGARNYLLGFNSESGAVINGLFTSAGDTFTFFDARTHDYPTLNFNNASTRSFTDSIARIFSQPELYFFEPDRDAQHGTFAQGNMLFSISTLDIMPIIAEAGFDWGIVPVPAINIVENSAGAVRSFVSNDALAFSMLRGAPNTEAGGYMLEALSVASHHILRETYLQEKLMYTLRDIHSARVLSDIVGNVTYSHYNMHNTIDAFHGATVGLIIEAAAQRIISSGNENQNQDEDENESVTFDALHEAARERLDAFFETAQPFMRN